MISNRSESGVAEWLESAVECRRRLADAIDAHPEPFALRPAGAEAEFAALTPVEGRPNRARLLVFTIDEGPLAGTPAVFFHKQSRIPFSHDRFSYGVCLVHGENPPLGSWIEYAASGFDPGRQPDGLRKAFTFTIPELPRWNPGD
jgi:hypothetical protein